MDKKDKLLYALADCENWKWMDGMKTFCGVRLKSGWLLETWVNDVKPLPDIDDPATKGALLSMARTQLGDPGAHCLLHEDSKWSFMSWPEERFQDVMHDSEGECLAWVIIHN